MESLLIILQALIQLGVNDLYIKEKDYNLNYVLIGLTALGLIDFFYFSFGLLSTPLILLVLYLRNTTLIKNRNEALIHGLINIIIGVVSDHITSFLLYSQSTLNLAITSPDSVFVVLRHLSAWAVIFAGVGFVAYKIYDSAQKTLTEKGKQIITLGLFGIYSFQSILIYNTRANGSQTADVLNDGLIFATITSLILLSAFFLIKRFTYKRVQLEREIETRNLRNYTEQLETNYNDMRKFRHDYINILSSMSSLIQTEDIESLKSYFNTTILGTKDLLVQNSFKLEMLSNIQIQSVKGLIATKLFKAQELGHDVKFEAMSPIISLAMDELDLCRCIGILIDNAIESGTNEKINVAFIQHDNAISFVVQNTFKNNLTPISRYFESGYSTKGDNRGLGLSNLKNIVDPYANVHLDTDVDGTRFTQEIIMEGI